MDTVGSPLSLSFPSPEADPLSLAQDDKPAESKDASTDDVEMKTDEANPAASTSTPAAEAGAATPAKSKRKAEVTTSRLSNLSRVTPTQLSAISFPSDARYIPVRPVVTPSAQASSSAPSPRSIIGSSTGPGSATSVAGGGGILMVRDTEH